MARTQVPGSQVKDESIESADIKDDTIVNADINVSAAIEVSKLASVESTIIGRKTSGTTNVHLTVAEARALIEVENPVDFVIILPIDYELSDKGKMVWCNNILYIWNGVIWEENNRSIWYKRSALPAKPLVLSVDGTFTWTIPYEEVDPPTDPVTYQKLPYAGYYQCDVFVYYAEWLELAHVNRARVNIPQTLSIQGSGDLTPQIIDRSGNIYVIGDIVVYWYKETLQGSAIVYVNGDRDITVTLTLPNGVYIETLGNSYIHMEYLGNNEGEY